MDPVEKLFRDLPSPAADRVAMIQNGEWDQAHFTRVIGRFSPSGSRDPDRKFLAKLLEPQDPATLRSQLGKLAIDKPQIPDDGSAKSQQLKYHAWIFQGRKDEEYPFKDEKLRDAQPVNQSKGGHAFLPAKLTDPKVCANCANPDTDAACGGCLLELDSHAIIKTVYCNKTCQTQHWAEHKSQCLGRRKLSRAVSLIHDLFIMFQKRAWTDKQITGIVEKQGITNIIHGEPNDWALQGKPFVRRFPSSMAPSEEHALAVLLDSECQQLLTTCQGLVKLLLLPICRTLEEVEIMPRNAYRPTCDMRHNQAHNAMFNKHTVLCVTLMSGEKMVVDMAGVQYGWRETVAPWGAWTSHRVVGKLCYLPFGSSQQAMQMLNAFSPQFVNISESQRSSLAQKMQVAIQNKMKESNASSAVELYRLGEAAFASCKLAMLSSAAAAVDSGLRELYESKVGLCYIDERGLWQATTTKQQAEALKKVWLSDEDVKTLKDKGCGLAHALVQTYLEQE
ncbi:hypothetical protein GGR51DRAFT_561791 [Nemania sp. FL0031]|nr:hypothetical protein GGR51DRAFT_561791 [Nemania sp. FL0031]